MLKTRLSASHPGVAALFPVLLLIAALLISAPAGSKRPNIILIVTDDQGYGDIAVHGNSMIRTPNMDRLHHESVRFTNFHVDPTCAPTRSALMTGRYSSRTGVWHTVMGRSLMDPREITLPQVLAKAGYRTGFFGKWHLGDDYPLRPEDRGFQEVVRHGGGGVQQTPDYWGNDYFDDTYWHNGKPEKYQGYCTDVWFREALRFIESRKDQPFFVYLATNAPHGPYFVDPKYSKPYEEKGVPQPMANFYGMIENLDENLGTLRKRLADQGLDRDTVLIFLTDNGSAAGILQDKDGFERKDEPGWIGFNAGMRGHKGSEYEGGHRVPLFVHYPAGNFTKPRDVARLSAHVDIMPTILDLAGASVPEGDDLDGRSLRPLLEGSEKWPDRTLTVHSQRIDFPIKWKQSAVMTERWRLVDGKELYDVQADPGQRSDVASANPQVVAKLRNAYGQWWNHISGRFDDYVDIPIGSPDFQEPVRITAHDWHTPDINDIPWNQPMVMKAPYSNGEWRIEVARDGIYEFDLYQRDKPANFPIEAVHAAVEAGGARAESAVPAGAVSIPLRLSLKKGRTTLRTVFRTSEGKERGAFYLYVKRVG